MVIEVFKISILVTVILVIQWPFGENDHFAFDRTLTAGFLYLFEANLFGKSMAKITKSQMLYHYIE